MRGVCIFYLGELLAWRAVWLRPEAVPEFGAADVQRPQGADGGRPILHPAHPRPFQALPDDLAAGLGRPAADVPATLAIPRVIGAMAIVLEVTDQLAQLLPDLGTRPRRQAHLGQMRQQGFAALLVEDPLGLAGPGGAGRLVAVVQHLGKVAQVLG